MTALALAPVSATTDDTLLPNAMSRYRERSCAPENCATPKTRAQEMATDRALNMGMPRAYRGDCPFRCAEQNRRLLTGALACAG